MLNSSQGRTSSLRLCSLLPRLTPRPGGLGWAGAAWIRAPRGETLELVTTRQTRRSSLLIADYGISTELPLGTRIAIVTQDRGRVSQLCPVEDSVVGLDAPRTRASQP